MRLGNLCGVLYRKMPRKWQGNVVAANAAKEKNSTDSSSSSNMNESGYAGLIIYAATPRLDSRLRPSASARMTAVCYFTILLFVILTKIPQFVILVEMNESGYAGLIIYAATPRLDSRLRPSASARMTLVVFHRCSALASCSAELPAIPGDNPRLRRK